jgi:hypothetical protein
VVILTITLAPQFETKSLDLQLKKGESAQFSIAVTNFDLDLRGCLIFAEIRRLSPGYNLVSGVTGSATSSSSTIQIRSYPNIEDRAKFLDLLPIRPGDLITLEGSGITGSKVLAVTDSQIVASGSATRTINEGRLLARSLSLTSFTAIPYLPNIPVTLTASASIGATSINVGSVSRTVPKGSTLVFDDDGLLFLANKTYSNNLLPANGSGGYIGGGISSGKSDNAAFGHFNPLALSGNTLTANTTPANGFYYRADVKPNTAYKVTSPQPAVPLTGTWRISVAFSNDGTSLALPLNRYDIDSTEFFFRTSSSTVKVDIILERTSSGSTDSCLFYGFSMFEVLPDPITLSMDLVPGSTIANVEPLTVSIGSGAVAIVGAGTVIVANNAAASATSISVSALSVSMPSDTILNFATRTSDGWQYVGSARLATAAVVGNTSINVHALSAAIPSGAIAWFGTHPFNTFFLAIDPSDTQFLESGNYGYDVICRQSNGYTTRLIQGNVQLTDHWSDGV